MKKPPKQFSRRYEKIATDRPGRLFFKIFSIIIFGIGGVLFFVQGFSQEPAEAPENSSGIAYVVNIDGPIGPAMASYVANAFQTAREGNGDVIILLLSTPGGLDQAMRTIIREILDSPIPVAGFVYPSGSRAASAGTYIIYACHVAAMAPGTNLGAATPVQIGGGGGPGFPDQKKDPEDEENGSPGQSSPDTMSAKAINDAVAYIRSLAHMRNRNADWAEKAVRESVSLPVNEAAELNVIDLVAANIPDLLEKMDGLLVSVKEDEVTLHTRNLIQENIEPGLRNRILMVITDPNIALILMLVGVYGLIFEFANPGTIGPGILGAVSLLFGMYALNMLPLNYTGLALLFLGVALMVSEAFVPSFGVLGFGGIAAFILGSAMLIEGDAPGFSISWKVIAGTAVASGGILIFLLGYIWKVHRGPVKSGSEEMIGSEARVLKWAGSEGYVHVHGERWRAKGPADIEADSLVRVRRIQDLVLYVEPVEK